MIPPPDANGFGKTYWSRWRTTHLYPGAMVGVAGAFAVIILLLVAITHLSYTTATVSITPAASTLVRTGEVRSLPDATVLDFANEALRRFESINIEAGDPFAQIAAIIHPRYRTQAEAEAKEIAKIARDQWWSRSPVIYKSEIISKNEGTFVVRQVFERLNYVGESYETRRLSEVSQLVSVTTMFQDQASPENMYGLYVLDRNVVLADGTAVGQEGDFDKIKKSHRQRVSGGKSKPAATKGK